MKLSYLLLGVFLSGCLSADAQVQPFKTSAYIDISNIKASHQVHGDMWYTELDSFGYDCKFPKQSGKHIAMLGSLWMSGYDAQNNLHLSAQSFRRSGVEYWPGPVVDTGAMASDISWNRIWKVGQTTIDSFLRNSTHTAANTPAMILEWPAKGNPNARGSMGLSLNIARDMAPFIDVNNDGVYNALDGDYPKIKGDQMLWWLIQDKGPTHNGTNGAPLIVEIANTAYAYHRSTVVDNIIFYEFQVTNRSANNYHNYRFGFNADIDVEYAPDDLWAYDSTRRALIVHDGPNAHMQADMMAGMVQLEVPSDRYPILDTMGSAIVYKNNNLGYGNPSVDTEYNNLLHQRQRDGSYTNRSSYHTPNDSFNCASAVVFEDLRILLASTDNTLTAGQTLKYAFALIAEDSIGACPNLDFTKILNVADTAWKIYKNPLPIQPTGIKNVSATARTLSVYPNPATDLLNITLPDALDGMLRVFDATGKTVSVASTRKNAQIQLASSLLAPGIYLVEYRSAQTTANNIFVKQ